MGIRNLEIIDFLNTCCCSANLLLDALFLFLVLRTITCVTIYIYITDDRRQVSSGESEDQSILSCAIFLSMDYNGLLTMLIKNGTPL